MNYDELIARALKGRSVLTMSKQWGIAHATLSRYVKGERMPDFDTALKMVNEAGAEPGEAFAALARAEQIHRSRQFKLQSGFAQTNVIGAMALAALAVNLFLTPPAAAEGKIAQKTAEYKLCEKCALPAQLLHLCNGAPVSVRAVRPFTHPDGSQKRLGVLVFHWFAFR